MYTSRTSPAYSRNKLLITSLLSPQTREFRPVPDDAAPARSDPRLRSLVTRDSLIVSTVWNERSIRSTRVGLPSHSRRTLIVQSSSR
jgi:hypothetical protein